MSTNPCHNTSYVDLYLLEMDLTIGEGLVNLSQTSELPSTSTTSNHARPATRADLSQTPELPNPSTTSNRARPATRASRTQNQDTESGKYFVWSNDEVLWLVTILFDIDYYQKSLLKVVKYPWFEMFHKIMSKYPSAGPVTLVTSSTYDPVQAAQSSNGDTGDAMEEDNNPFPSCRSIPGLEALAEGAPDNPIGPRVLSLSSAFPSPSTSSNPFGSPGATPHNHLASTAFGVDQEPESTGLSSPTKKTSASKKQDDIADLV
ncbi:uncharacterized protein UBRO2_05436 [Ustilago bromivora]|uniref:Uncharacterized protein n=1 Tax=Ustilago bromivora TaxID=307758 RepID=A0A8H8QRK7_9BASI|nr:uncharacterized protein UBRO2_05436 [Ustilago bromivora]